MATNQIIAHELLVQLADVVNPTEIGYWPLAPGWFGVGVLLLCLGLIGAGYRWAHWRRHRYRSLALQELSLAGRNGVDSVAHMLEVLRRTTLMAYPRERIVGLSGDAWLAFIERSAGLTIPPALRGLIADGAYLPEQTLSAMQDEQMQQLKQFIQQWIRQHQLDFVFHDN